VVVVIVDRARVAEHAEEKIGEEVGEQLFLFELIGARGAEEPGPMFEPIAQRVDARGQFKELEF